MLFMKKLNLFIVFFATMIMFTSCEDDEPGKGFTSENLNFNCWLSGIYDDEKVGEYGWNWKCESYDEHTGELLREVNLAFMALSDPIFLTHEGDVKDTEPLDKDKIIGKVNVYIINHDALVWTEVYDYFYSFDFKTNQFYWYKDLNNEVEQSDFKVLKFDKIDDDSFKLDGFLYNKVKFKWGE